MDRDLMLSGAAANWLESRRDDLNYRFERAQRKFPSLTAERVFESLTTILPPLAAVDPTGDLCSSTYDLVLLHVGRDSFAKHPGLLVLFRDTFPRLAELLAKQPKTLPAALSNAVENLTTRGADFAREIVVVAAHLQAQDADVLLGAGGVLAWRLGEARLREHALGLLPSLPDRVCLTALGLADWPDAAAKVAIALLANDAWQSPRTRVSEKTLRSLHEESEAQLLGSIAQGAIPALADWRIAGRLGDFSGFGGAFDAPPVVLDMGDRHTLHVRVGDQFYRLHADCFGCTCHEEPEPERVTVRTTSESSALRKLAEMLAPGDGNKLSQDGQLTYAGQRAQFGDLAGSTAFACFSQAVACSFSDSHRIRVLAPMRACL